MFRFVNNSCFLVHSLHVFPNPRSFDFSTKISLLFRPSTPVNRGGFWSHVHVIVVDVGPCSGPHPLCTPPTQALPHLRITFPPGLEAPHGSDMTPHAESDCPLCIDIDLLTDQKVTCTHGFGMNSFRCCVVSEGKTTRQHRKAREIRETPGSWIQNCS